eukprot:661397-Prymnesium_polylepis.1
MASLFVRARRLIMFLSDTSQQRKFYVSKMLMNAIWANTCYLVDPSIDCVHVVTVDTTYSCLNMLDPFCYLLCFCGPHTQRRALHDYND